MKKFNNFINESKKSQQDFLKKAEQLILRLGGKLVNDWNWRKEFDIPTIAGNYRVSLINDTSFNKGSKLYTIYGKFDNIELAKEKISDGNLNRYSGKYNFHYLSAEDCLDLFEDFVESIKTNEIVGEVPPPPPSSGDELPF